MKVLVTGGAGFVGSILVPHLLQDGFDVIVYDSLIYDIDPLLLHFGNERFRFISGDVRDGKVLGAACKEADAIVHLAALVGYPVCKKDERQAMEVNVGGSQQLIEVSRGKPIVFASTGSCYGNLEGVCREESPLRPLTIYGDTKKLAEEAFQVRGNVVIYRFATGYGVSPRLRLDLLINDFCYKAVHEKNLIVYERHFKRTFIHVVDMARAFSHALTHFEEMKDQVYNVGSENMNLSKQKIAEFIRERVPFYLHYADIGRDEDKRDYEVSYKKMRATGFMPEVTLACGVTQLIELFTVFSLKPQYSNV